MISKISYKGDMTIGDTIRDLRTAKGYSLRDLSKLSGISAAAISRWESGQRIPSVKSYNAIMAALGAELLVMEK